APQDALAEPARRDMLAHAGTEQKIAIAGDNAARAGKLFTLRADESPDQTHRRARHGAAADADRIPGAHKGHRFLKRYDLLAQAAVTLLEVSAQLGVRLHEAHAAFLWPTSALNF